jgi:hypothetical protein
MSRKNFKLNFIALLTGFAILLTAIGCESVTGPTPVNSLSNSPEASFAHDADNVGG